MSRYWLFLIQIKHFSCLNVWQWLNSSFFSINKVVFIEKSIKQFNSVSIELHSVFTLFKRQLNLKNHQMVDKLTQPSRDMHFH